MGRRKRTSPTNAIGAAYQDTIRTAAAQWQGLANISLVEVASGSPASDITIGWGSFAGSQISSQIGETRFSYLLTAPSTFLPNMTIHLEDPALQSLAATPAATYQGTATTLLEIATHKFGHALGLGLSDDPSAVMYLAVGPNNPAPNASDIAGLQSLYGVAAVTSTSVAAVSAPLPGTIAVEAGDVGIYRFFDSAHGTEFLTGSMDEALNTIKTVSSLTYEGFAMAGIDPGGNDPNAAPVFRFFDTTNGTHFYTANQPEKASIAATRPDLIAEPASFLEHVTQQAGDTPVYRFFETGNGSHFFTASASERASISATRPDMIYEGIGFYAPSIT